MSNWTKSADWIPYTNAVGWLIFWKDDLRKAMNSLMVLDQMKVPKSDPGYKMTLEEIQKSKQGIADAQKKLKEALARLTQSDKETWKDKKLGRR